MKKYGNHTGVKQYRHIFEIIKRDVEMTGNTVGHW